MNLHRHVAQSEKRLRFLYELAQATRALSRPEEVMVLTARLLGEHLQVNRCAYAQVEDDQDHFQVFGDYNHGVASIVGRYAFTEFGEVVTRLMRENLPFVNSDVDSDPRTAASNLAAYRLTEIQAVVCVPLHKDGRFVAAMAVHQRSPRGWTEDEIDLIRTVVDRCWDALDRIRAETALREAHQRLSFALSAGELGDWSWDPESDLIMLSDRAAEHYGLTGRRPLTRHAMRALLHDDDRARAKAAAVRAAETRGVYEIEYRVLHPEGLRWLAVRGKGVYLPDGRMQGMVGITQDVTARRLAQEQARSEADMLDLLNRTGAELAGELDLPTLLQRVTDAATQLTGARFGAFFYNGTDEQGDALLLYTLSGADKSAFEHLGHPRPTVLLGPTFKGDAPIRSPDITHDPRYGQWAPNHGMPPGHLPLRSYLAVPVSRAGVVIGGLFFGHPAVGVFTDRSERLAVGIAAQAAVAVDNARLYAEAQRASEERKALLESERAARAEAERASLLKDEFLATLSHELRTPLSAILGWVHLLRRRALPQQPELEKGVNVIERSARVQLQLIEDLLDMSRITSGKLRLNLQPVAPMSFVQAAVDTMRHAAEAAGVALHVHAQPDLPMVLGDSARLQQIVWNLVANAVKFTPQGGRVRVAALAAPRHWVEITVEDTGHGIAADFLPHLFDRFRQADGSITRRHGGLGLGLSIVKHLAEAHGGHVRATSPGPGMGARFTLCLPCRTREAQGPGLPLHPGAAAAGEAALVGVSLVVVDDDADSRELLQRLLEEHGAQVRTAATAAECLLLLSAHRPDLLISDIGMPDVDGYELLRRVRQQPELQAPPLPTVALTAFARHEDRDRALQAGFNAHLTKPLDPAALLATVRQLTLLEGPVPAPKASPDETELPDTACGDWHD